MLWSPKQKIFKIDPGDVACLHCIEAESVSLLVIPSDQRQKPCKISNDVKFKVEEGKILLRCTSERPRVNASLIVQEVVVRELCDSSFNKTLRIGLK